ncbi:unnamed protein product [Mucor hiemalis]
MTIPSFAEMGIIKNPIFPIHDYNAFINFFQKQAQIHSDKIYFRYQTKLSDGGIVVKTLTFGEVDRITTNLACEMYETLGSKTTIALVEDHSICYPILQIALHKLRVPVLLLSPRNSVDSVVNLLCQVNADVLLYGQRHGQLKDEVIAKTKAISDTDILFAQVPNINIDQLVQAPLNYKATEILDYNFTAEDLSKVFVIIHSSGTTSFPKAIRWSNRFQLYHLQGTYYNLINKGFSKFIDDENDILLAITPSWHMFGLYSNFNTLLNGSSYFYFEQFPPSATEVIKAIKRENITRVSATPHYINQMIHYMKETGDLERFQKLKLIASGGAPISKDVDDFIAKNKLNFLMLYAMSECCNLMGSDLSERKINSNIYFFNKDCHMFTYFEHFDQNRYQLIIKAGAPFLASGISLRSNGDYATKDLFTESPLVKNGYTYVGRADDTLVMVNGEKTDPLPMEDVIKSDPLVSHCTVIGEALPCTAALIELDFETVKSHCLDVVLERVHQTVTKANKNAPSYSTILPQMVKIIPFDKHLPTTDKGTVSRKRAIQQFQVEVDDMYKKFLSGNKKRKTSNDTLLKTNNCEIYAAVMKAIQHVLGEKANIQEEESLFRQGLNSIRSIQLTNHLSESFSDVPQDFLYDYSSVKEIVLFFEKQVDDGSKISTVEADEGYSSYDYQLTTDILESYLKRASVEIVSAKNTIKRDDRQSIVLLTGATGSLGSYILYKLLENKKVKKVYALVRSQGNSSLINRISDGFIKRGYPTSKLYDSSKLEVLPMNLEKDNLGFCTDKFNTLRSEVTTILACAWLLDFKHTVSHYNSECLEGLYNLVKFASRPPGSEAIDLHFISSVSASSAYSKATVPEESLPADPRVALPMGYAQSKYIVEQLFDYLTKEKKMPCFIYRVGQLCGDSTTGIWNSTEMYPLMMLGGTVLKKMPAMNATINWLPIDYAGQAIIDIMLKTRKTKQYIFHLVNTKTVSWSSMLEAMKGSGVAFENVDPESWVEELSKYQNNPAYKLLSFYKNIFAEVTSKVVQWETSKTERVTTAIISAPTVNDHLNLYLRRWTEQEPLR